MFSFVKFFFCLSYAKNTYAYVLDWNLIAFKNLWNQFFLLKHYYNTLMTHSFTIYGDETWQKDWKTQIRIGKSSFLMYQNVQNMHLKFSFKIISWKSNLNGINNLKCNRWIMSLWLPSTWWLLPATGEHYSALPISITYTCTLMLSFCEENACRRCRNMHKGRNIKNGDYFQRGVAIGYLWVNEQTLKKWLSLGLIMRTRLCLRKAFVSLYIFSE